MISLIVFFSLIACQADQEAKDIDLSQLSWDEIIKKGQSQKLSMMMWKGDPKINAYMQNYIKPRVKENTISNLRLSADKATRLCRI